MTAMLPAEPTDEQKKELFIESQQEPSTDNSSLAKPNSSSSNAKSKEGVTKKHSVHHKAHPSPTPHSSHHQKHSTGSGKSNAPSSTVHHVSPADESLPESSASHQTVSTSPKSSLAESPQGIHPTTQTFTEPATPPPSHPAAGPAVPTATPPAITLPESELPHGANPSAPITIEKSGAQQDQGLEPPQDSSSSGWNPLGWLFGSHENYSYLTASTRAAIDRAPVRHGRWKYIVVHNSGTREGNAAVFNIYHLRVRHMKNGLAYHFVIGNGHGSGDGQIEIGHRWTAQLNGGHVASDYLNDIALGICLVGDFNRDEPTKAQIGALAELITYLRKRVGKVQGRQSIVYAHKEINPRPTDCPGARFPYSWLHAKFGPAN